MNQCSCKKAALAVAGSQECGHLQHLHGMRGCGMDLGRAAVVGPRGAILPAVNGNFVVSIFCRKNSTIERFWPKMVGTSHDALETLLEEGTKGIHSNFF